MYVLGSRERLTLVGIGSRQFHVDKVNLELSVGLDTDQQRRSSSGGNDLVGEMTRLEDESERTFELLDDGLDQVGKVQSLVRLRVVNVFAKHGDGFSVGVGLEHVSSLLQNELNFLVVGDDTVVHQAELVGWVADVGVAVQHRGLTVSSPTSVSETGLGNKLLGHVEQAKVCAFAWLNISLVGSGFLG